MITKLKLNNWRSHLDTELVFSEGTNCFIGKMGAGKTSVLDGMCFALFGTFPALQSKKIKLADVVMKKPKLKQEASVDLAFNIDGSEWNVKRMIINGRSTAELRKDGRLVESPQSTKVTDEIERVLKINYDLFTRAIYSEQNQIDMFLTIPKGQRMKKIDQLLAIDKFEKSRLTTKALINKCNLSVVDKQQFIDDLKRDDNIRNVDD
ncbi:MAG: SMC family ATPase, partial [Candidatus Aenigmarchaeota archaeon]|nr:SMC family ATPase [Candidatus Aenigmarchaeota archaeon]